MNTEEIEFTTLRVRVEGDVQGVGFRAFAVNEGKLRGLRGWVRNRLDGTLEALVSGPTKEVEGFIHACMRGPAGARVANIDLIAATAPDGPGFTLRPTL